MAQSFDYDILIIGSGAAGLGLALSLAHNARVVIISKDELESGSSQHAQGGIAAVMNQTAENINSHIKDTLQTGAGLCDPTTVNFVATQAKKAICWLLNHGIQFTTNPQSQQFHLTQEGGHSQRRILHASDRTGAVIIKSLAEQVMTHPNIDCCTQKTAIDLILQENQCIGAYILDNLTLNIESLYAKETLLACGGASSVYQHTTNPDFTSGDGIAMGWRAGCQIKQMEFNQFHPTCLFYVGKKPFLISEALRGEGAHLILPNGSRFMTHYDQRAELAPRDIVARAIHYELQQHQIDHVYLDISYKPKNMIQSFFPTIYQYCYQQGIDITKEPIPVVPAAHYTCGGIATNLQGQTNIPHLYAIGETACTGLHGANRMASNSLLECFVFATSASQTIKKDLTKNHYLSCQKQPVPYNKHHQQRRVDFDNHTRELRKLMWNKVGIVRHPTDLLEAAGEIQTALTTMNALFPTSQITRATIEYRNLVKTAELIVNAALCRKESVGLHHLEAKKPEFSLVK